jgi:hypothetical protein
MIQHEKEESKSIYAICQSLKYWYCSSPGQVNAVGRGARHNAGQCLCMHWVGSRLCWGRLAVTMLFGSRHAPLVSLHLRFPALPKRADESESEPAGGWLLGCSARRAVQVPFRRRGLAAEHTERDMNMIRFVLAPGDGGDRRRRSSPHAHDTRTTHGGGSDSLNKQEA